MSFFEFLADLTVADWALLFVAWVIIAFALGAFTGLAIKRADKAAEPCDWYCTDGQWRTESEAVAWVAENDGSLAEWLAVWPTVEEPIYVPREWVA